MGAQARSRIANDFINSHNGAKRLEASSLTVGQDYRLESKELVYDNNCTEKVYVAYHFRSLADKNDELVLIELGDPGFDPEYDDVFADED